MEDCRAWLKEAGGKLDAKAAAVWRIKPDEWISMVQKGH